MKKLQKLTAWILTLAMLMMFIPATLTVNAEDGVVSVTVGGVTTNYTDIAEAITAAEDNPGSTFKLLDDIVTDTAGAGYVNFTIDRGDFTIDLAGKSITSDEHTIVVNGSGTKVTFTDSTQTDGTVSTTNGGGKALTVTNGGEIAIEGGSYIGYNGAIALSLGKGTYCTIIDGTFESDVNALSNSGTLVIADGTFITNGDYPIDIWDGSMTILDGDFTAGAYGVVVHHGGSIDISSCASVLDMSVMSTVAPQITVSASTIKLPDGYSFFDSDNNATDVLDAYMTYTVGEVQDEAVPVVNEVTFNSDSPAYIEGSNTFYVSDSNPFILTVKGENLRKFSDVGGLEALFKGETSSSGWVITNMSIQSDTEAKITIDTSKLSYILNNSFGSDKTIAVMVENRDTQYGNTVNVNIAHAPTYAIRIKDSTNGRVEHNNLYSDYIPWLSNVNLTITPNSGYELESLMVDGADVTDEVTDNIYTFTMPAYAVDVEATFKSAPVTYTVTVSADKTEAEVGETVTLTAEVKANGTIVDDADVSWETTSGSGLNSDDALTATITPEGAGVWTVTAFYDPTPADNENNDAVSGSVTVTITEPIIPAITDVIISGDEVTVDNVNKTYTVMAGESITITVYGTDFDKITEEDYTNSVYGATYVEGVASYLDQNKYDDVSGSFIFNLVTNDQWKGVDIQYTNDGGNTWIKTGWKLVIETPVPVYDLWIGGERFTGNRLTFYDASGGTAVYTPDTNTLTLNDYSFTDYHEGIYYEGENDSVLNLVLNGENSIVAVPDAAHISHSVAVVCLDAGLTISGDGSLNAKVNNGELTANASAIYVEHDITIKGGEITATAGETDDGQAIGITSMYGDLVIEDGIVTATGGKGSVVAGLATNNDIIIKGGDVTATGGNASSGYTIGIMAFPGDITVEDGNVTATGGNGTRSYGLYGNNTSITGGVLTAEGDSFAIVSVVTSIGDGLGVYDKSGVVIESPDFNTLTYAKIDEYTVQKYRLTWSNGDGGSYEQDVDRDTVITVPDNEFFNDTMRKTGYTITGWTNGEGYNVGDLMPAHDLTFTAQYTANTYTITFDPNGGEVEPASMTTVSGKLATLPTPTRSGYSFSGWFDAETGGNKITTDTVFDSDTTVYAQWRKKLSGGGGGGGTPSYTVKFEENGGTEVASKTVTRNSTVEEPTAPVKDGFTFEGWYIDQELLSPYNFDTSVTKSFTLYAKWSEDLKEDDSNPGTSGHNCPSLKFNDLDITQWYHYDTDYVIEKDIFRGTTEKTFTPDGNITRAMMITVLYRAEGEPEVIGEATFEDIDEDAYYAKAVVWGQQNGIIKGYSETEYAPEQDILREQIAAIMHRYAQYKGYDVSVGENTNILSYEDFDEISDYAIPSMQWAVGSGMIKGRTESTLNPDAFATRVEIAAMLHRFIESNK